MRVDPLAAAVETAALSYCQRPAASDATRSLTFADVDRRANALAHLMRGVVGHGAAVAAALIGNRAEAVEFDVACIKAGVGRLNVNPRLAADEVGYVLADAGARVLLLDPRYEELATAVPADCTVIRLDGASDGYEARLAAASTARANYERAPDDASLIMYTSGTTGRPKGAVWTFRSRWAAVQNMLVNELTPEASAVMAHLGSVSHGSGSKIVPVYLRGGENRLFARFDPEEFLAVAGSFDVTATFVVPTMVQMLLDAAATAPPDALAGLRHIAYGGAKMPVPVIRSAIERFGPRFVQVYGASEAPHPVLILHRDDHRPGSTVLDSAGRPCIGVDVRLGEGLLLPEEGAEGEILVRSPHLFAGYLGQPAATAAAFRGEYYRTGDVGRMSGGVIEIVGRERDMIISGGLNVYPAEVERVLLDHPHVAEACVFGVADERWGEAVVASVVAVAGAGELDADDVLRHCRERLAGYKKPRDVAVVDALPRGVTGKVSRDETRNHYQTLHREVTT